MTATELTVASKEQTIYLQNGYIASFRFDMIYKRWFYDLYNGDGLLYAGVPLTPDTMPLMGISPLELAIVDVVDDGQEYEPYSEIGGRLMLMELTE